MPNTPLGQNQQPDDTPKFISDSERLNYYWKLFLSEFPTEDYCVQELYRRIYKRSIRCPACSNERIKKLCNSRIILCYRCRARTFTLAGTFFHNIRKAQRWLGAIWFLEHGISVSASSFARLTNVVSSTAQAIFKKISFVAMSKMSDLPEAASSNFIAIFRRRSRMTPAGEHPVSEQSQIEKFAETKLETESDSGSADTGICLEPFEFEEALCRQPEEDCEKSKLNARAKQVYDSLPFEPVHFEVLQQTTGKETGPLSVILTFLEIEGLVKRDYGNWYMRTQPPTSSAHRPDCPPGKQASEAIASFINHVRSTFNGISRKYLQNYLGWYWCLIDRNCWRPGTLLNECSGFGRIYHKEILDYVSPALVKFSPVQTK